jgi:hypothetical protein
MPAVDSLTFAVYAIAALVLLVKAVLSVALPELFCAAQIK